MSCLQHLILIGGMSMNSHHEHNQSDEPGFWRSREGANKSYGTRAFTGNPLILND